VVVREGKMIQADSSWGEKVITPKIYFNDEREREKERESEEIHKHKGN
jgi:hypothetical protein